MEEETMCGRGVGSGNSARTDARMDDCASGDSESAVTSESAGDFDAAEWSES
jgi:hypothetical protein